jgi:acetyl esterase/lipase
MKAFLAILTACALTTDLHAEDAKPLAPTHANVTYGPHERNDLDFWKADGDGPRPLLVFIHGGGWAETKRRSLAHFSPIWPRESRVHPSITA